MKMLRRPKGNIATITVLVVSSILLLSGIAIVMSSVDYSKSVKNITKVADSGPIIDSCFEESMYRLKLNTAYTGNFNLTIGGVSCSANIQNDSLNSQIKVITLNSTIDGNSFQRVRKVNVSGTVFVVVE